MQIDQIKLISFENSSLFILNRNTLIPVNIISMDSVEGIMTVYTNLEKEFTKLALFMDSISYIINIDLSLNTTSSRILTSKVNEESFYRLFDGKILNNI